MPATQTLITAATGATTKTFEVYSNNPATLIGWGFSTTVDDALVDVQISYDGGTTFVDCFRDSTQIRLTSLNNPVTVYGPGLFRINKGITTGTVGVAICAAP